MWKYIKSKNCVVEQPNCDVPIPPNPARYDIERFHLYDADLMHYEGKKMNWDEHIASLRTIELSERVDWIDGQLVREGVDFKIGRGKQIDTTDQQQWQQMSTDEKDGYFEPVAIPLSQPPKDESGGQGEEKQDELWDNLLASLYDINEKSQEVDWSNDDDEKQYVIQELSKHYLITRKINRNG